MKRTGHGYPRDKQDRVRSLNALLLSLILGGLGIVLLLSTLGGATVVSASQGEHTLSSSTHHAVDPAPDSPATGTVQITKTVEPANPDTGAVVSICFAISGLGPRMIDVVLAQDVSGSMNQPAGEGVTQTRLEASQAAAVAFVNSLPDTDRAAVVPYSTTAYLGQVQPLTTAKSRVLEAINALTAQGDTNIGEGISVSHRELITSPRYLSNTVKLIVLLSDGQANRPLDYPGGPAQYAKDRADAAGGDHIKIYTIGFGSDADEELLEYIANTTGGTYFFAPDGDVLETIYLTIALELHNLVITDILPPGVETDCANWHDGCCVTDTTGVTTITYPISDSMLIADPAVFCFTATVNWDPNEEAPVNLPGSGICYQDAEGETICEEFVNPEIVVGGRKIVGHVFYDANENGQREAGEAGAPDVVVRTSTGVTTRTNASGGYVLRTSTEPAMSVTVDVPPGHDVTTPISEGIPASTGVYTVDFGIGHIALCLPLAMRNYVPPPFVVNGGFERGWTGWTHGGELDQSVTPGNPYSGDFSALLGDPDYDCEGNVPVGSAWVEQTVFVPSYLGAPTLSFRYNILTQDRNPYLDDEFDRFDVRVDNTLVFADAKKTGSYGCELDPGEWDLHWQLGQVDLGAYSGQTITIRFENGSRPDGWFNTWTYLDDVRIED